MLIVISVISKVTGKQHFQVRPSDDFLPGGCQVVALADADTGIITLLGNRIFFGRDSEDWCIYQDVAIEDILKLLRDVQEEAWDDMEKGWAPEFCPYSLKKFFKGEK